MNTFEIDNKRYTESILKTLSESKNRINNEGAKEILSSLLMYETLKKYKEHQKPMNLLLYGKSGSGKTFLVEQLLKSIEKKYIFTDMKLYSDVGYQGKDVISIFEDFLANENYNLESVENGIIVFDEFDKIQTKETNMKDITGLSIQHSLLKIMDGTTLNLSNKSGKRTMGSHININTSNMTFIFIGAFSYLEDYHNLHQKLASNGFTVELINRFSNIIKIKELDKNDIMKFLNINNSQSPFHYYIQMFSDNDCEIIFNDFVKTCEIVIEKGLKIDNSLRGIEYYINSMFYPIIIDVLNSKIRCIYVDREKIVF